MPCVWDHRTEAAAPISIATRLVADHDIDRASDGNHTHPKSLTLQPSWTTVVCKKRWKVGDMSEGERRKLEHRLAQARRLAALPVEDLTKERIAGLIRELEEKLGDNQEQRS